MRLPGLLALLGGTAAVGAFAAQPPTRTPRQGPLPRAVRLAPAEAARLARETRKAVSVQLAPGLAATPWATEKLVADPIALDIDGRGNVYVTSSSRSGGTLDIRGHPNWVPTVHTLTTTDSLRAFYRRELAPERSAQNPWLPDLNKDGSRDWRDLTTQLERVTRLSDRDGDGVADAAQVMTEGFNTDLANDVAGGLLWHDGALYLADAPDIWRLRDANGDGTIDAKDVVSTGYNTHPAFFGHGLAGLTLGPDGRIYWSVGDMGFDVTDKAGRRWSMPNQGAILRMNPDGSDFEVFAAGLRNPQAFAFDEYGNLIAADNDGDHPGETERLVYVTNGSDAGWRSTWQYGKYTDPANNRYNVWMDEGMFRPRFDGQAAYITPPVAPYHSGPAGMVYEPGTALGARWRNTFLVSSFPGTPTGARVWGLTLRPDGAGFALASDTTVVQGVLAVGMRIGPDGALYLADWIDGWDSKGEGRIWKIDSPADAASPVRREVRALLGGTLRDATVDRLRALLAHADYRVRQKAQLELARRGDPAPLLAVARATDARATDARATDARATDARLARVHALWGLGQLARADASRGALLVPFLRDGDAEVRAQAAKLLGDVRHAAAADSLVPLLKDDTPRARFFAAEALGRIAYAPAVPAIVQMLADADDRDVYLRQAGATALARIGQAAPVAALSTHPSRGVRLAAVVALRRMRSAEVARFLDDREESVVTEAARAINDEGSIAAALPALARALDRARPTNTPLVRRAIAANLQLGTPDALDRVAAFAARDDRPDSLRADAVATLGAWAAPSTMNRVDGAWLGRVPGRDPAPARAAVARLLDPMLRSGRVPLQVAAIDAASRLGIADAAPALLAALRDDPSAVVRVAALRALPATGAATVMPAVRAALVDREPAVRTAALGLVPTLGLGDDAAAELLASVVTNGSASMAERQGALATFGRTKGARAVQAIGALLDQLDARTLAPELRVDVVDAAQGSESGALKARTARYASARTGRELMAAYGDALLRGGNPRAGAQVVFQGAAAQCTRCHTIGQPGADVGPPLTRIGATLSREQLLEALVEPSARLAPGYGTVVLTLRDGKRVTGVLQRESDAELTVQTASGAQQRIPRAGIAKRDNAPSAMPPMGTLLKPREIRDVVEFLSTLR